MDNEIVEVKKRSSKILVTGVVIVLAIVIAVGSYLSIRRKKPTSEAVALQTATSTSSPTPAIKESRHSSTKKYKDDKVLSFREILAQTKDKLIAGKPFTHKWCPLFFQRQTITAE